MSQCLYLKNPNDGMNSIELQSTNSQIMPDTSAAGNQWQKQQIPYGMSYGCGNFNSNAQECPLMLRN
jgi:hypothetical protein